MLEEQAANILNKSTNERMTTREKIGQERAKLTQYQCLFLFQREYVWSVGVSNVMSTSRSKNQMSTVGLLCFKLHLANRW